MMGKPWETMEKSWENHGKKPSIWLIFLSILFHISMVQCFIFNEHNRTQARPSVAPTSRASQTLSPNLAKHSGPRLAKWVKLGSFEIKIMQKKCSPRVAIAAIDDVKAKTNLQFSPMTMSSCAKGCIFFSAQVRKMIFISLPHLGVGRYWKVLAFGFGLIP